jgi:hypothetical protein
MSGLITHCITCDHEGCGKKEEYSIPYGNVMPNTSFIQLTIHGMTKFFCSHSCLEAAILTPHEANDLEHVNPRFTIASRQGHIRLESDGEHVCIIRRTSSGSNNKTTGSLVVDLQELRDALGSLTI